MYEVADHRPRGTSTSRSAPELPILFHLIDVSRPKTAAPAPPTGAGLTAAAESLTPPLTTEVPFPPPIAFPAPASAIPENVEVLSTLPPKLEIGKTDISKTDVANKDLVIPTTSSSAAVITSAAVAERIVAVEPAKPAVSEPGNPEPPVKDLVQPANVRKKRKTTASEDWFASHGKFIAIAFVLALAATIYFARTNRQQPTAAKQDTAQSPLATKPAGNTSEQNLWPETTTKSEKASELTSNTVQAAAASESKVELLAPQMVAESPADKKRDNLFEFASAKNEERVATRTDEAAKSTSQPPTGTGPEVAAYPVTPPPASRYPVTNPPAAAYPATALPPGAPVASPPMPPAQPQTYGQPWQAQSQPVDYRSQYPVAPAANAAQQQAWPPSGYGGQSSSYQPFDNTARGPRNERTGSGTY